MKRINSSGYFPAVFAKIKHLPFVGHIDLTYRCNFRCVHCFCRGSEDFSKELPVVAWKDILDQIHQEGCLSLDLSGGEPFLRRDFFEIYHYAWAKGFLITLMTNASLLTQAFIERLAKNPPYAIEVTLNAVTEDVYASVTGVSGMLGRVQGHIREMVRLDLPVRIKANCLSLNGHQIAGIKHWTEALIGRPSRKGYRFAFDPMIYPRFNGDVTPCRYRLSPGQLAQVQKEDPDMLAEFCRYLGAPAAPVDKGRRLYRCDTWKGQFVIDPFGRLKICPFAQKPLVDLTRVSFREGFYKVLPQIEEEVFKTASRCRTCDDSSFCGWCPAKAFLETGSEEKPVAYFCQLARELRKQEKVFHEDPVLRRI